MLHLIVTDLPEILQLLSIHGYSGDSPRRLFGSRLGSQFSYQGGYRYQKRRGEKRGYYALGLYLGLSSATLDAITLSNKGDIEGCLRECLKAWLLKADVQKTKGGPTIYSLVSALRELGENEVAEGIDMESKFSVNEYLINLFIV